MTLLVGKKLEIFKKHRQAEFQILLAKTALASKFCIKLAREQNEYLLHDSQNLSICFLASQLPHLGCY